MKTNNLYKDEFINNYRVFAGVNLDEDSSQNDRIIIMLNNKYWYFEDTKTLNAFVRIRNEHINKVRAKKVITLDFYEVIINFIFHKIYL